MYTQKAFVKIAKIKGWTPFNSGGGQLTDQGLKFILALEECPSVQTIVSPTRVQKLITECTATPIASEEVRSVR